MAASDILKNNVKDKLTRGEVVASMTVRLSRSIEIARIASTAGFDMLYIDLEHSPLTMDATGSGEHAGLYLPHSGRRRARRHCAACALGLPAEETAKAINDATMAIGQFESGDCLEA